MMKTVPVLVAAICLLSCGAAGGGGQFVDLMQYEFQVALRNGQVMLDNVVVTIPVPQNGAIVDVVATSNYKIVSEKSAQLFIGRLLPGQMVTHSLRCKVYIMPPAPFDPLTYNEQEIPENIRSRYTVPVQGLWEADSPQIKEVADNIAAQTDSRGVVALRILTWVREHMQYEPNYRNDSALAALLSGKGDCVEYSNLFIAIARALGIPCRGAIVCPSGTVGVTHMIAEVYHPLTGWAPFDPVAGKYGEDVGPFVYVAPVENQEGFMLVGLSYVHPGGGGVRDVSFSVFVNSLLQLNTVVVVRSYTDKWLTIDVTVANRSDYRAELVKVDVLLDENFFERPQPAVYRYVGAGENIVTTFEIQVKRWGWPYKTISVRTSGIYAAEGITVEKVETRDILLHAVEQPHYYSWLQAILLASAITVLVVAIAVKLAKKPEKVAIPIPKRYIRSLYSS